MRCFIPLCVWFPYKYGKKVFNSLLIELNLYQISICRLTSLSLNKNLEVYMLVAVNHLKIMNDSANNQKQLEQQIETSFCSSQVTS